MNWLTKHFLFKPQEPLASNVNSEQVEERVAIIAPKNLKVTQIAITKPLTRRDAFENVAVLGAAVVLMPAYLNIGSDSQSLSEDLLIGASTLSGDALSKERVQKMRSVLGFNLNHLEMMRLFDPDEEEPVTLFRL